MAKTKICLHCGQTFDPNDRRDLSDPQWLPAASVYCSHECSDRFHCNLGHCCSTHVKEKAQRGAAKAAHPNIDRSTSSQFRVPR
ncbi:ferric uptake regulation protein [Mycobacterium kubicae]|uniref:ferric uptake regulation protein n=1 Tax=Mycobacterium kubicae TaxID=120959 RepID=UPI0009EF4F46|nr:ferric uptake regulation protein [Mycobacterium kubicae]